MCNHVLLQSNHVKLLALQPRQTCTPSPLPVRRRATATCSNPWSHLAKRHPPTSPTSHVTRVPGIRGPDSEGCAPNVQNDGLKCFSCAKPGGFCCCRCFHESNHSPVLEVTEAKDHLKVGALPQHSLSFPISVAMYFKHPATAGLQTFDHSPSSTFLRFV